MLIDCTVSPIVERYRTGSMDVGECLAIVERIKGLYLWFSPSSPESDMVARLRQHPNACVDLLINPGNRDCIGFSVHYIERFEGFGIMFRGGTVVHHQHRSSGYYRHLLEQSVPQSGADFITAMTQNPRVYETIRSFSPTRTAYPSPALETPEVVRRIAESFCKAPGLNSATFVVPNIYEEIRKEESFRQTRDDEVMRMFKSLLGKNDALFMVSPLR